MKEITKTILNEMESSDLYSKHNLKSKLGNQRTTEQINQILNMIEEVEAKHGVKYMFDNNRVNQYTLASDKNTYTFNLYRDVIAALQMLLDI